jgi:hypothetical protein
MVVEEHMPRVSTPLNLDWWCLPESLSQYRSGVTSCLLGELDTGGQVEFRVDVREVG